MTHMKRADLTSASGALVLGVGLGALLARSIGTIAGPITVLGIAMHAFGMWDKHRLEAQSGVQNPTWIVALYWVCWLLLATLLALLLLWSR